jgi:DNA-binding transcriptional ArsR family regulator
VSRWSPIFDWGTVSSEPFDPDPTWKALSDPTRRRILDELRNGPRNTSTLCERFDHISRHGVIKHLKVLEAAELIRVEALGRERLNHLNPVPLQEIYERWLRPYERFWATSLHRLGRVAEGNERAKEKKTS